MVSIAAASEWRNTQSGAVIGLLELSEVENVRVSQKMDERKRETEAYVRERYGGCTRKDLISLPVMSDYVRYYRRFKKTYHLQLQVESIVFGGKSLPNVSALVDANFAAEMETLVLTAGHDVAKLHGHVSIDVSREGEQITQMNGTRRSMHAGDMIMRDDMGVCCSIIYGQDNRSPISLKTSHVLFVSYAPVGVSPETVDAQLRKIEENVRLFSPALVVEQHRLLSASS